MTKYLGRGAAGTASQKKILIKNKSVRLFVSLSLSTINAVRGTRFGLSSSNGGRHLHPAVPPPPPSSTRPHGRPSRQCRRQRTGCRAPRPRGYSRPPRGCSYPPRGCSCPPALALALALVTGPQARAHGGEHDERVHQHVAAQVAFEKNKFRNQFFTLAL